MKKNKHNFKNAYKQTYQKGIIIDNTPIQGQTLNAELEVLRRQFANLFTLIDYKQVPEIIKHPNTQQITFDLLIQEIIYECLSCGECPIKYLQKEEENKAGFFVGDVATDYDFIFDLKHILLSKMRLQQTINNINELEKNLSKVVENSSQLFLTSDTILGKKARENIENRVDDKFSRPAVALENNIKPQLLGANYNSGGDNIVNVYKKSIFQALGMVFLQSSNAEMFKLHYNFMLKSLVEPSIKYIITKLNYHYAFDVSYNTDNLYFKETQ